MVVHVRMATTTRIISSKTPYLLHVPAMSLRSPSRSPVITHLPICRRVPPQGVRTGMPHCRVGRPHDKIFGGQGVLASTSTSHCQSIIPHPPHHHPVPTAAGTMAQSATAPGALPRSTGNSPHLICSSLISFLDFFSSLALGRGAFGRTSVSQEDGKQPSQYATLVKSLWPSDFATFSSS
jgi:hypothetical protein